MKKSVQEIEDFYLTQGYRGTRLRKAMEKDKELQQILAQKRRKMRKLLHATKAESKKYLLATDGDFEILGKCKTLKKSKISKADFALVKTIESQLKPEWRKDLLQALNKLLKKYKIGKN